VDPYRWSWDADALVVIPGMAAAYAIALTRFPAPRWRIVCFASGCALMLAVQITPLDTLALHYLLVMHLLQNVVLAEWAPALLVLGVPPALAALIADRLPGARVLLHPAFGLPVWLATYFLWHLPPAYDTALRHPHTLLHLEHACYVTAGTLFWWPLLQNRPHALRPQVRAAFLFGAFVLASPLGLLLALLPNPIYDYYEGGFDRWSLSAIEDQQIAGVTMAGEQALVFFGVFAVFFFRFLAEEERDTERA
jgi:putative membrane protein